MGGDDAQTARQRYDQRAGDTCSNKSERVGDNCPNKTGQRIEAAGPFETEPAEAADPAEAGRVAAVELSASRPV